MNTNKTKGEIVFEDFCDSNNIEWEKTKEGEKATPDYKVVFNNDIVYVEVKQIDKDDNFKENFSSRTVGSHVRKKIKEAINQLKEASKRGSPAILLIYNNLDGLQMFGTEQHDFIAAMYGEMTLIFDKNKKQVTDHYYGRNHSFNDEKSIYFSAVGFLYQKKEGTGLKLYENIYAKNKLNFSQLPVCIEAIRIDIE